MTSEDLDLDSAVCIVLARGGEITFVTRDAEAVDCGSSIDLGHLVISELIEREPQPFRFVDGMVVWSRQSPEIVGDAVFAAVRKLIGVA